MTLRPLKLIFNDIIDRSVQDNFRRIKSYLNQQKQFIGFSLIELEFVSTATNELRPHNLGFQPKDAVITSIVGDGTITLNYGNFTKDNISLTVGGTVSRTNPTIVRMYVGTNSEGDIVV